MVVRVRVRVCDIGDGGVREEGLLTGRQASRQGREGGGKNDGDDDGYGCELSMELSIPSPGHLDELVS